MPKLQQTLYVVLVMVPWLCMATRIKMSSMNTEQQGTKLRQGLQTGSIFQGRYRLERLIPHPFQPTARASRHPLGAGRGMTATSGQIFPFQPNISKRRQGNDRREVWETPKNEATLGVGNLLDFRKQAQARIKKLRARYPNAEETVSVNDHPEFGTWKDQGLDSLGFIRGPNSQVEENLDSLGPNQVIDEDIYSEDALGTRYLAPPSIGSDATDVQLVDPSLGGQIEKHVDVEVHPNTSQDDADEKLRQDDPAKPGVNFPLGTEFDGHQMKHLGMGKFGDAWEATDLKTGQRVVVKVFYDVRTGDFVTWRSADQQMKWLLLKDIEEAKVVREIVSAGRKLYPSGASRICDCLEENVQQGMANPDASMYSVWEMAGNDDLRTLKLPTDLKDRVPVARAITKQILEGLVLLSMFDPPIIHHDLKPDNVVVNGSLEDGYDVKIIDFGCFMPATEKNMRSASMGDEKYMAPEWGTEWAFVEPAYSFDMWAAGLIFLQLIAPDFTPDIWYPTDYSFAAPTGETIFSWFRYSCPELFTDENLALISEDLALIFDCLKTTPGDRPTPIEAVDRVSKLLHESGSTLVHEKAAFKAGDICEMFLDMRWVQCVVAKAGQATYDMRFCDMHGCRIYENVDPAAVRKVTGGSGTHLYVPDVNHDLDDLSRDEAA